MEQKIQALITATKEKFGLTNYYLHTSSFRRSLDIFEDTTYILTTEWLPSHAKKVEEDDLNPPGTAIIDINVHTGQLKSILFVDNKSFAEKNIIVSTSTKDIIQWIEEETGLTYNEQFQLVEEGNGRLFFKECFMGIPVSPSGSIEIKYNQDGQLTFFSAIGQFPPKNKFKQDVPALSLEKVADLSKKQIKLIEFPLEKQKQVLPFYGLEEIYITNDLTRTIPYEFFVNDKIQLAIDKIIYWDSPTNQSFEKTSLTFANNITIEQVISKECHPNLLPITNSEKEQCISTVSDFLRQEYPNDTGKWILKTLYRQDNYIYATLKYNEHSHFIFKRKLLVIIDAENLQAINSMDNQFMLNTFEAYTTVKKRTVTENQAFDKLKNHLELTPIYVYDKRLAQYILCGKLDCGFSVNATNGELVKLDDL
ncbi:MULTISPECIES: hypothetical protein [Lysinibacillus]|uniref:hypothetical protein n=1 Tax=Lysinibacillus TaxID=400634 RepID=UPI0025797960|nr:MULTISPECIES: hypothetical protein [Lysinibacillus]